MGLLPQGILSIGVSTLYAILFSMVPYVAMVQVYGKAYGMIISLIYLTDILAKISINLYIEEP